MEIIPSDLATYGGEAKRLLQDLQTRNERMFLVTILIMNTAALPPEARKRHLPDGFPLPRNTTVRSSGWTSSRKKG